MVVNKREDIKFICELPKGYTEDKIKVAAPGFNPDIIFITHPDMPLLEVNIETGEYRQL